MALLLLASTFGEREALFDTPKDGISFKKQFLLSYVQGLLLYVGYWYVANYNFENSSEPNSRNGSGTGAHANIVALGAEIFQPER